MKKESANMARRAAPLSTFVSLIMLSILPSDARAEPITFVSGNVILRSEGRTGFNLRTNEFATSTAGCCTVFPIPLTVHSGELLDLSVATVGSAFGTGTIGILSGFRTVETLTGVTYDALLRFNVDAIVLPVTSLTDVAFSRPFTVSGFVRALDADAREVFNLKVTGTGSAGFGATASMDGNRTQFSIPFGINYTIQTAQLDPVPEPTTLLLVGSGALALVRRRRRQAS